MTVEITNKKNETRQYSVTTLDDIDLVFNRFTLSTYCIIYYKEDKQYDGIFIHGAHSGKIARIGESPAKVSLKGAYREGVVMAQCFEFNHCVDMFEFLRDVSETENLRSLN